MSSKYKDNYKQRSSSKGTFFSRIPCMRSNSNSSSSSDTSWSSNDMVGMSRCPSYSSSISTISRASTVSAHDVSMTPSDRSFTSMERSFTSNGSSSKAHSIHINDLHSDSDDSFRSEFDQFFANKKWLVFINDFHMLLSEENRICYNIQIKWIKINGKDSGISTLKQVYFILFVHINQKSFPRKWFQLTFFSLNKHCPLSIVYQIFFWLLCNRYTQNFDR